MTSIVPLLSSESADTTAQSLRALRDALPNEQVCLLEDLSKQECASVDVAIAANPRPELLDKLPNLVWLQSLWAGVEQLIEPARARNLHVVRLIDPELGRAMSEAALAWTLYLHRLMPQYAQQQHEQRWQSLPWRRAQDTRVTVFGLGELGSVCAHRLHENGFSVSGWSSSQHSLAGVSCYSGTTGFTKVLPLTDILLVLLPLTEQTRYLLDAEALRQLPTGASVINFARGALINTADLLAALDAQALSHAVLDVFETEPLPQGHRLWTHPAVTVLPHVAAPTDPASAIAIAAGHITAYRATGAIPEGVNLARGF